MSVAFIFRFACIKRFVFHVAHHSACDKAEDNMGLLPVVSAVAHSKHGNLSLFGATDLEVGQPHDTKYGVSAGYSIPEVSVDLLPSEAITTP